MVQKVLDEHTNACLIIAGLLGSGLFIILGYWSAAAIGIAQTDYIGFFQAFNLVLDKPFAAYYNNYTPILMVLGFVLAEFIFYLFLLYLKRQDETEIVSENAQIDIKSSEKKASELFEVSFDDYDSEQLIYSNTAAEQEVFEEDIIFSNNTDFKDVAEKEDTGIVDEVKNTTFNSEEMAILMQKYDIAQIAEMKRLSSYMEGVNVNLLMKTFRPSMSAREIKEYIDIFYGSEEV